MKLRVCAVLLAAAFWGSAPYAGAAPKRRPDFARHYRVIEQAYRSNRWTLLNDIATRDYRFVGIDGTPKTIAELERGGKNFARQGGRIVHAVLHVDRVTVRGNDRVVALRVMLDVSVPRPGSRAQHLVQVSVTRDSWRSVRGRFELARTVVTSEAVTQFGSRPLALRPGPSWRAAARTIAAHYATIDRAWRQNRWDLLRPFATADAHVVEVDGSPRSLDEMNAGGKSFQSGGGVVRGARLRLIHITADNRRAIATTLLTATGSYPAGSRRLGFAQRDDEQDVWREIAGRWRFSEGRIIRQTITTYAP